MTTDTQQSPRAFDAIMGYPTAWEFIRATTPESHHERCSWRSTNGAFLCDCSVIWIEYGRRAERAEARSAAVPEPPLLRQVGEALVAVHTASDDDDMPLVDLMAPELFEQVTAAVAAYSSRGESKDR